MGGTDYTITTTSELLSVPNANYAQIAGTADSESGVANPGIGSWGNFSIPNTRNKRPPKVTIKYLTTVNRTGLASWDVYCQSEWYDDDRDGLGNLFYKVDNADQRTVAAGWIMISGNGLLLNTNKLGELNCNPSVLGNNTVMQEVIISSTLTDITILLTQPQPVTINSETFTVIGPWKVLYNIEW